MKLLRRCRHKLQPAPGLLFRPPTRFEIIKSGRYETTNNKPWDLWCVTYSRANADLAACGLGCELRPDRKAWADQIHARIVTEPQVTK